MLKISAKLEQLSPLSLKVLRAEQENYITGRKLKATPDLNVVSLCRCYHTE
jgi:hypothetical protein